MTVRKRYIVLVVLLACTFGKVIAPVCAQTLEERYRAFQQSAKKTYADFRDEANNRYAAFLAEAWKECAPDTTVTEPKRNWEPPVVYQEPVTPEPPAQLPVEQATNAVYVDERPEPVAEVTENREPTTRFTITFYGTPVSFRHPKLNAIKLTKVTEKQIAKAWQTLAGAEFDNLLYDCLSARDKLQLCDYAYGVLLGQVAERIYGHTDEAVLLKAFLYAQSGYAMRLASTQDGRLHMLMGSKYLIFNQQAFKFGDMYFYPMEDVSAGMLVCEHPFDNEQPMTLLINADQQLAVDTVQQITRRSRFGIETKTTINRNLIDFYNNYPTGNLGGEIGTRLAIYANAPLEQSVQRELYPTLSAAIQGNSERDAVNKLLNYVQTAFTYEYDDVVWGEDRAFFPLESLYYPYNDCEDRSILFSRLVRDLVHLPVILVYYPGHLAAAVRFNEDVRGDFLLVDGKKYVVCDPTYIGASVGKAMPQFKNATAKVITLQ